MHAIGHRAREQFGTDLRVLYLTSEQFTNDMVASIRSGKMEDFRDRYRTNDILMIDDIQFIGGKDSTEEEFFHTFNHLYQAGKRIILTSDRLPKAIPTLNDRLRTRFEMGLTVDVQPPDLETRIAILNRRANRAAVRAARRARLRRPEGAEQHSRAGRHADPHHRPRAPGGCAVTLPLATAQ